ncbi:MAG: glutamine synthetase family protein [Candidatus Saccharibacteria bacterium]|nr:glutamine synthetase family protein [Candidatus Saccharibacteria bacterium]
MGEDINGSLKQFLELSYDELEELNLAARQITDPKTAEKKHAAYIASEKQIKAVTVFFSDIEGRLHMLDYDKRFFLGSLDGLTFDGSSIKGLSEIQESDLRLVIDWTSFTYLPADVFGSGKVAVFANICNRDLSPYESDYRSQLQAYARMLFEKDGTIAYMAPEIEGFLLKGTDAEQQYDESRGFELISTGGYYHSLPLDDLRHFIDNVAEAQRVMGFQNEKDHPEVAPSQFEMNYSYTEVVRACDQAQLYKLVCRQIAASMGMTATFLPKPIQKINGNGMHLNFSVVKDGKNIFYDPKGQDGLSDIGWQYVERLLYRASDLCLIFNPSINSYRRLDPNFEAPNQIKVSAIDRSSMIRIPLANSRSSRIEIRSVAPDANPYLAMFVILKTGLEDKAVKRSKDKRERLRFLPGTITDAIRLFQASDYTTKILGESAKNKYLEQKKVVRDRNPRELGTTIKDSEVIYHHEITNQYLWNQF